MNKTISIVIVDDHAVVREGIDSFMRTLSDIDVVGAAASGEEAVTLVRQTVPDVVLMDLVMPGIGGVEATRQICQISPHSQVVVLTSYHQDENIFPALRAGARSYVLKDIEAESLADTIRRTARGEAILDANVATRVMLELNGERKTLVNAFGDLTEREMDVLRLIADGLSNAEIAKRLVISEKTVKVHVSNILSKLHLADRTRAAVFAWKQGLVSD
jgi:NarL family two-component system response regulator LiaR